MFIIRSRENYDVVILGSSRANNILLLNEYKGLKAFNYGMSGGNLLENFFIAEINGIQVYNKNNVLWKPTNLSNEQMADGTLQGFAPIFIFKINRKAFFKSTKI
jgi:hypothetical protein